jgi:hypothetical protein
MAHGKIRTQPHEQKKIVGMKTYHEIFITSATNTFNDIKMVLLLRAQFKARVILVNNRDEDKLIS